MLKNKNKKKQYVTHSGKRMDIEAAGKSISHEGC